jgi:nitroimidazol reductase NimA-like FMN-containing flavoprotein (pyridoxamine 5'-phosphate oxidase superfamily)
VAESTVRSRILRHPERSRRELAEDILARGRVAHVAFTHDGQPVVLPFTYHYEDGCLYMHGAPASRAMRILELGVPLCVEVTLLDGLVASRNAKSHSVNYRSVVIFGRAGPVRDETTKRVVFERMTARYFPGRRAGVEYLPARNADLRAVTLLAVAIEELSAKARSGPPLGKHDDIDAAPGSSYVLVLGGQDV